jgi:hypothetical protein
MCAREINLKIADLSVLLTSRDAGLKLAAQGAIKAFAVPSAIPDVIVRAGWKDLAADPGGQIVFDSGGVWQLYRTDGLHCFDFKAPSIGSSSYKRAYFDPEFRTGDLYLNPSFFDSSLPNYPLEYPLDELLILALLSKGLGVEVHACGIGDGDSAGYLFLGQSGAGKTTTAMLWRERKQIRVLSDDRIIVRLRGAEFWMYGTPWHGEAELALPDRAPLTQICFLRHGPINQVRSLSRAETVARLFSCAFASFYNQSAIAHMLAFFHSLAILVPAAELTFVPDEQVVDFVRSALS